MTKRQHKNKTARTKAVAESGSIIVRPSIEGKDLMMEVHYCTVFLGMEESIRLVLALLGGIRQLWGEAAYDALTKAANK